MATTTTIITGDNLAAGGSTGGTGTAGNNEFITASGANDTLLGGTGSDTLIGTGSNAFFDTYSDKVGGNQSFDGGNDILDARNSTTAGDSFETGTFNSTVYGSNGADFISSNTNDTHTAVIYGFVGNDTISAGDGAETIFGGAGADSIQGFDGTGSFVSADEGNDTVFGYEGDNVTIYGGNGDDSIVSSSDNGQIYGNQGNDTLSLDDSFGGTVFGGAGNDLITTTDGSYNNFISADLGNDTVILDNDGGNDFFSGNNTVYGGNGDDTITGSSGSGDQLYGNQGNDTINLLNAGTIFGGAGNDLLTDSTMGGAFISGDLGADSIFGVGSFDTLYGGDGNDSIAAGGTIDANGMVTGANVTGDQIYGQAGNDIITITSQSSTATVYGGAGNDSITVTFSSNTTQNAGNGGTTTTATAGNGTHYLSGDLGVDTISGGVGGDTFAGGAGGDVLISHRINESSFGPTFTTGTDTAITGTGTDGMPSATGTATNTSTPATAADLFLFDANDSTYAKPSSGGTGSDGGGGGEANFDHITGFLLNVTAQTFNAGTAPGSTAQSAVNANAGDNLYFGKLNTPVLGDTATLDTNVFYGIADNKSTATTISEGSDYAVAYQYAFGSSATSTNTTPGADAHFANAVDFIVVQVEHNGAVGNGNIYVFDHSGNGVALVGAGAQVEGEITQSQNPNGTTGVNNGLSATTVNIYH